MAVSIHWEVVLGCVKQVVCKPERANKAVFRHGSSLQVPALTFPKWWIVAWKRKSNEPFPSLSCFWKIRFIALIERTLEQKLLPGPKWHVAVTDLTVQLPMPLDYFVRGLWKVLELWATKANEYSELKELLLWGLGKQR